MEDPPDDEATSPTSPSEVPSIAGVDLSIHRGDAPAEMRCRQVQRLSIPLTSCRDWCTTEPEPEGECSHDCAESYGYPDPGLSACELNALLLTAHTSSFRSLEPLGRLVDQAISKMLITLPTQQRQKVIGSLNTCDVELPFPEEGRHIVTSLLSAIRGTQQVRIDFVTDANSSQRLQTKVSPYRLIASSDHWKLIGRSSLHRGVRHFNVSRICSVEITGDTFRLPKTFLRHYRSSDVFAKGAHIENREDGPSSPLTRPHESSAPKRHEDKSCQ